jgi:hypothetical protein
VLKVSWLSRMCTKQILGAQREEKEDCNARGRFHFAMVQPRKGARAANSFMAILADGNTGGWKLKQILTRGARAKAVGYPQQKLLMSTFIVSYNSYNMAGIHQHLRIGNQI